MTCVGQFATKREVQKEKWEKYFLGLINFVLDFIQRLSGFKEIRSNNCVVIFTKEG